MEMLNKLGKAHEEMRKVQHLLGCIAEELETAQAGESAALELAAELSAENCRLRDNWNAISRLVKEIVGRHVRTTPAWWAVYEVEAEMDRLQFNEKYK